MWWTLRVDAVFGSLIAVLGTLFGSISTYVFQRKATERAAAEARLERLRQERLTAYGAFAGAVTDFKRGAVSQWYRRKEDNGGPAHLAAIAESDRLAAAVEAAVFRMHMVSDTESLHDLADAAYASARRTRRADDEADLRERERRFEARMKEFIAATAASLR